MSTPGEGSPGQVPLIQEDIGPGYLLGSQFVTDPSLVPALGEPEVTLQGPGPESDAATVTAPPSYRISLTTMWRLNTIVESSWGGVVPGISQTR